VAIALLAGADAPALAQPATGAANTVFDAVSKSVVSVHVFESKPGARKRVALGSAVAIAPARVVTNCHVLASAIAADTKARDLAIEVKVAGQRSPHKARLANADPARDLCVLEVAGLEVPVAALGSTRGLKVGQPVYAVGSPHGLELTLSGGLISSLRRTGSEPLIQTDAAVSGGSSGGGLFDANGRLIGITTFGVRDGQNLNFALPVEWVRDASVRGVTAQDFSAMVAQLRKMVQGGAGAKGTSAAGGRWQYAARSPQGYDVYVDAGRLARSGSQALVWVLHNFDAPAKPRAVDAVGSRVLLVEFDCAAARWTLRHAATYTAAFGTGRRLSADDLDPTGADYRQAAPGGVMDTVRTAACR
jgi:hypothetical protein